MSPDHEAAVRDAFRLELSAAVRDLAALKLQLSIVARDLIDLRLELERFCQAVPA